MITKKDLSKNQLKYFQKELDEERQAFVLRALNRKPIHKKLKAGMILDANYDYIDGLIVLKASLSYLDKVLWHGEYIADLELARNGFEAKGQIIENVYSMLWSDICDEEHGYKCLKKILN